MTEFSVKPSGKACGAEITGVDLSQPLNQNQVSAIRDAWLNHHVLSFPDQHLNDDDLERFSSNFGILGEDPFFGPIPGRTYVAAIRREADDTAPIFAELFHSDWSFMAEPPIGTVLYGLDIPPYGGDTIFVNQTKAFSEMPEHFKKKLLGKTAIHSAKLVYAPDGFFGDKENIGSMDIRPSEAAHDCNRHPLVREHPETGRLTIFGAPGIYIVGIEGMSDLEFGLFAQEIHDWQTRPQFVYQHKWQNNMLLMWDNRCVLHRASGGYEGHRRELHRVTIYPY